MPVDPLGKRHAGDLAALFDQDPDAAWKPHKAPTMPEVREVRAAIGAVELDLAIPGNLAYLEGHFPGLPIVPGVVLIDWVIALAARHLPLRLEAAQTFVVKFRHVMRPGDLVTLSLRYAAGRRQLAFEYRNTAQPLATGMIDIPALGGASADDSGSWPAGPL
jgi:3-hydroxymyristoyl/3-hydroxydecanoyl-(acyl carrier protein) dehydratase